MKNVFLIGNGFDLHHKLPTKYFDFICVAKYLTTNLLCTPINMGDILSKCQVSQNIKKCYEVHKNIYDNIEIDFTMASDISNLLKDNIWFKYFDKTLNTDLGWIDFEKEISTVINSLDNIISIQNDTISISRNDCISAFILNHFRYFVEIEEDDVLYDGETIDIKEQYLKEYI